MSKETEKESVFSTLYRVDVNDYTEKKNTGGGKELTYLTWSFAWAEVVKRYPDATYTIYHDEQHRPYIEDADFGIMCYTTVTINGQTHEMWLPVMNGANKSMKRQAYTYQVYNSYKRSYEEKTVEAATMFDINKTIMRCLVKNLAMFGLGLYIYAGEDLPETPKDAPAEAAKPAVKKNTATKQQAIFDDEREEAFMLIKANIESAPSLQYLSDLYHQNPGLQGYQPFMDALAKRKKELA